MQCATIRMSARLQTRFTTAAIAARVILIYFVSVVPQCLPLPHQDLYMKLIRIWQPIWHVFVLDTFLLEGMRVATVLGRAHPAESPTTDSDELTYLKELSPKGTATEKRAPGSIFLFQQLSTDYQLMGSARTG